MIHLEKELSGQREQQVKKKKKLHVMQEEQNEGQRDWRMVSKRVM